MRLLDATDHLNFVEPLILDTKLGLGIGYGWVTTSFDEVVL